MKMKPPVISVSREQLEQMPISVLVELVLQQKDALEKLTSEIERLKQRPQRISGLASFG